jgi:twinkle protein
LANAEHGRSVLDRVVPAEIIINGDQIHWERYLYPEDKARIVPAEALAEAGINRLMIAPEREDGLTLPWPKVKDDVLIRPGKLAIWAGWTHHGKTQMLKQTMLHGIYNSERCLVASMEEEVLDVWADMAAMACGSQQPPLRDAKRFIEFVRGKLWLYDQQGMVDARKIQAVIRYAAAELKITQAVIDSLMMLAVDRDDYEAQARFVGELKTTAKDTGVTIHLVAHMRKRDGKGGDEAPGTIHDISGGHEIASKADYVFIVWRNKKPGAKNAPPHSTILKVDKQRGRKNWVGSVGLNFHQVSRQFVEDVHPMRFWDEPGEEF